MTIFPHWLRSSALARLGALWVTLPMTSSVQAQSEAPEFLSLEALTSSGDDAFRGLLGTGLWVIALILLLIIVIGFWSSLSKPAVDEPGGRSDYKARNLFLSFKFAPLGLEAAAQGQARGEVTGYLRTLDLHSATFVSPFPLQKGERCRLELGSLPGYPEGQASMEAHVSGCSSLGGEPESFIIRVKFLSSGRSIMNTPLPAYVRHLAHPGFSHA